MSRFFRMMGWLCNRKQPQPNPDPLPGTEDVTVTANLGAATGAGLTPTVDAPGALTLLGVGSPDNSLTAYPKESNVTTGDWYVDGSVSSSGDGTSLGTAFKTIAEGLSALSSGDVLVIKGGTYYISSTIYRSTSWGSVTKVTRYGADEVIIDGSGLAYDAFGIQFAGSVNEHWHGIHLKNVPGPEDQYDYNGQTWAFTDGAHDCKLTFCYASHSGQTGFYGYTAYNIQLHDCAAWRLGDGSSTDTNVPDGFAMTGNVNGGYTGIKYVRCVAANCPDDGFDNYRNYGAQHYDCVAIECGYYWNGNPGGTSTGDNHGFKMGSTESNTGNNQAIGCFAIGCRVSGFDDNADDNDVTMLRCTSVGNGYYGFQMGSSANATIHDNIAYGNGDTDGKDWGGTPDTYNTWNLGITDPEFESPGTYDYSVDSGSDCVGAGISGGNLGASTTALLIAKEWLAKDLT
jgi:hypothetical protein